MPHTSFTKSKADTLGLFLRKVAASASRTICDFGTRRCRAVASRCALILSGILQVIVVMPFDNTELHIEQYLNHLERFISSGVRSATATFENIAPFQLPEEVDRLASPLVNSTFPGVVISACPSMSLGSRQPHCRASFRGRLGVEFPPWDNFLGERFETRVAMKRSKRRIDPNCGDVISVVFAITFFEPIDRLVLIAQTEANQSK